MWQLTLSYVQPNVFGQNWKTPSKNGMRAHIPAYTTHKANNKENQGMGRNQSFGQKARWQTDKRDGTTK